MPPQLVMIITPHGDYYGELLDKHIFRGSERNLIRDDFVKKPLTDEWRIYLNNLILQVETSTSWVETHVYMARSCFVSSSGYIIPRIVLKKDDFITGFPKFLGQPPVVGKPPPVVVKMAPAKSNSFNSPRVRRNSTSSVEAVSSATFKEYSTKHKGVSFT